MESACEAAVLDVGLAARSADVTLGVANLAIRSSGLTIGAPRDLSQVPHAKQREQ